MDKAVPVRRTRLTAGRRRELILQAAAQVFAAAGYRAGKVSDIAASAGVTEPVVFQNFGSKAALYAAVLGRVNDSIRAELQALARHHGSASSLVAHVLSPPPDSPAHDAGAHRPLADAATLASDPAAGEPARDAARALAGHLADLIRHGQAEGGIRPGTDPVAAAWLLLSVLSSRPLRAAAMPHPDRLEAGVTALALQALCDQPAATPQPKPATREPGHEQRP